MTEDPFLIAGIEAGGTKFVCAVARSPGEIIEETRFPTTTPEETLSEAAAFFRTMTGRHGGIQALGIGTFGPADINPRSPGYGQILTTPKEGWKGFHFVDFLRGQLPDPLPIAFETDVNAAAIGESEFGAGRHHRNVAYLTVGTGIGGGFLHDGQALHGRMHPEIGHLAVPDFDRDYGKSTNVCPFHESCLEGRACGPAIAERWGQPGSELPADHPAWELEAKYLSVAAVDLTAAWSPDVLLFGGGVMQQEGLIERIRAEFTLRSGNYWALPSADDYILPPALGQQAGIVGALTLAQRIIDAR